MLSALIKPAMFFPTASWRPTVATLHRWALKPKRLAITNSMRSSTPRGCIVLPGLINMHQHHWYTLFKGVADGYLLEDWVSDFLLPVSRHLTVEAMRVSSTIAAMEMLATGTTCSFNHSVTTTTPELVDASIVPQRDLGIRQVYAKELRCQNARESQPSAEPRRRARRIRRGASALGRDIGRARAHGDGDREQRPLGGCRHEHGGAHLPRVRARETAWAAHQHAYRGRYVFSGKGLPEVPARDWPNRRALSDAARHPRREAGS